MALDGIGGVGAINVATTVKPQPKQQSKTTDIQISSSAQESAGSSSLSVDTIKPVAEKGNTDNKNGKDDKDGKNKSEKWGEVQSEKEVSPDKVKEAVDDINKKIKQASPLHHTACSFKYHDDTNRISITVKNADTDEVIREIPPEKALDMLAKAWEMAGILVDEKR